MGKHAKKRSRTKYVKAAGLTAGGIALPFAMPAQAQATTEYFDAQGVTALADEYCPELDAEEIDTAVRIAYAESGWNSQAHNPNGEDSRGLWQINRAAHGDVYGDLFNPISNTQAMCAISSGGENWTPWTTYTSGAYLSAPGAEYGGTVPAPTPEIDTPSPVGGTTGNATSGGNPTEVYDDHIHHTVKPGDTLYHIAQEYLGDGHKWGQVYNVPETRETVGDNPHLIFPGQDIRVNTSVKSDSGQANSGQPSESAPDAHSHTSYVHPVGGAAVSQGYGNPNPSYTLGYHTGTDFSAPSGTNVVAITHGTVVQPDGSSAYGTNVQIKWDDGTYGLYAHLSGAAVSPGTEVFPGDLVGYVGSTGNSSGPHLHFEIRTAPEFGDGNFLDPVAYLRDNGLVI